VLLSHWVLPYFVVASAPFETCLLETMFPNNSDGAFLNQHEPKPSDLLLHYNYGAAAVKHWGRNVDVLDKRPDLPVSRRQVSNGAEATAKYGRTQ
jgi:hypothetical protein